MKISEKYNFKIANNEEEFKQIHKLNYMTFVEEIPQREANEDRILIDQFHDENFYVICKKSDKIIGMLALRGKRPFSLDKKIPDLDSYLPEHNSVCEVRMLSIIKKYRSSVVFVGLLKTLKSVMEERYDLILISGYLKHLKLYKNLGFNNFAYPVGKKGALYQPMYLRYEDHKLRKIFDNFKQNNST